MKPGDTVAGRFELEREVASGGMGTVFRAVDRVGGGLAAVKVMTPHRHEGDRDRFAREASLLARLSHPAIVGYRAHGITPAGEAWLAMDWLEGEDLATRLARLRPSVRDSLVLVRRIADALGVLHASGVVHRDIKPRNIFLEGGRLDRAKLLDLGIARAIEDARLTRTGALIGTPSYMSPEQARGDPDVDARSDFYALGCVLYECIAGRPPFIGEHAVAVLAQLLLEDTAPIRRHRPDVPASVEELLLQLLARDRERRPRSASWISETIGALLEAPLETGERAAPAASLPRSERLGERERKVLSVVLAGGADPLSRTLTPEQNRSLVEQLQAALAVHGASLDPMADGSLLVTLSGAEAATDLAARAARCALALRARLPGATLAIATGRADAISDRASSLERVLLGHEVIERVASLLRQAESRPRLEGAPPLILLDFTTAGLLDARFELAGDDSGLELRGEREQVEVARKLLGKPTPCVGRDRELTTLEGILSECSAESVARVVLVTAAAGLGKSRVRHEFLRRLEERGEPVQVWVGLGDPMRAGSPFGLLAHALRRGLALADGEPIALRRQRLRARVARHVPAVDQARVTEFLGELVGVPFPDDESIQLRAARRDAVLLGDQMRRAWEDFLKAECTAEPVVLVLEDLQWGDLPTVQLVDAALRNLADCPLMVLALSRPEVSQLFPRLWAERALIQLPLGELPRRAAERLVREVLGPDVPAQTVATLVERAAGNALYLEELIRAVAQGGAAAALPETVLSMVEARLAALEPEARRVLRAASVFGKLFWAGGVQTLLGGDEGTQEIQDWLGELERREIIERRPPGRFPREREYVFRQALLYEASYAMLTQADRVLGHRLAGHWLVKAGDTDAAMLAEHFARGEEPARAVEWLRRASEQSLEGHDFENAIARAERAVSLGAQGENLGALRLIQAEAYRWRGELGPQERCATEAVLRCTRGQALWFRALEELITSPSRRGDSSVARAWVPDVLGHRVQGAAWAAQLICLCSMARTLTYGGNSPEVDALIAQIEALAGQGTDLDPRAAGELQRLKGSRARHAGDLAGDLAGYRAALEHLERAGDARNACNTQVSLGFAYIELGDYERAGEELEQALASAERMGLALTATRAQQNLGLVLAARGQLDEARALEERVCEASRLHGDVRFEGWTRIYQSRIAHQAGEAQAAEREARRAVELLKLWPPAQAGAQAALSQALLAQGRVAEAFAPAREGMATLVQLGSMEEFESLVRLAFAEAAHASGETAVARQAIAVARKRVLDRAAAIPEPRYRDTFLTRIPENRSILELAARWLTDSRA